LRVVTPPGHGTRYVIALLLLAAIGVFGAVSLSALAAESAFQARALEADVDALSARYDQLTNEVASLRSPDRVLSVAVDQLGMVPAEQPAYVLLDPDGEGVGAASTPAGLLAAGEVADPLKSVLGPGR
jgi:cell division protein FtsB